MSAESGGGRGGQKNMKTINSETFLYFAEENFLIRLSPQKKLCGMSLFFFLLIEGGFIKISNFDDQK